MREGIQDTKGYGVQMVRLAVQIIPE